jgi:large subunit ribosomal protein L30
VTTVRITQTRSTIGQSRAHEGTLRALGLGRIGKSADHERSPALDGQLRHVAHLVTVTALGGKDA